VLGCGKSGLLKAVFDYFERAVEDWRQLLILAAGLFLLPIVMLTPVHAHSDLVLQIESLTKQLELEPGNVELLLRRGDLQRRHEDRDRARADFKRVREIQSDNVTIDWFDGRLEIESGQPGEGVKYLNRFLLANPEHVIALQNRAQGYLSLNQPLLAAQDFAAVIRVSDRPAPSLFSANALALVAAGPDYFATAMTVVQKGLEQFPSEIRLTGVGVDISLAQSDTVTADQYIHQLPAPIRELPQWLIRQALLECQVKHQEQAVFWFDSASEASSESRHTPPLLTDKWLVRLIAEPTPANCRAAALVILQTY